VGWENSCQISEEHTVPAVFSVEEQAKQRNQQEAGSKLAASHVLFSSGVEMSFFSTTLSDYGTHIASYRTRAASLSPGSKAAET
jgi:hypothetical protein